MTAKDKKNKKIDDRLEDIERTMPIHYLEFIRHYLDGNTKLAALELCGKATGDEIKDRQFANSMMQAPAVKNYIALMKRKISEKTLEMVDRKLADIANAEILDVIEIGTKSVPVLSQGEVATYVEEPDIQIVDESQLTAAQRASIKSIKVVKGQLHVELHDPVKAMDMLIKRNSGYKETLDVNHAGNIKVFAATGDNGRGPKPA